jgi:hypothetical protein
MGRSLTVTILGTAKGHPKDGPYFGAVASGLSVSLP